MSPINPIGGPSPAGLPQPAQLRPQNGSSEGANFGKTLRGYVDQVNRDQQASTEAVQDLLAGKTQDPLPVVTAAAKADLSFKLLLGVRNKVVEAYKETMRMQV